MGSALLNNATDTWVYQYQPSKAQGTNGALLYAGGDSGKITRSLLYFGLPFPRGVTIVSAKLRMVQYRTVSGSRNPGVYRATQQWSATKATYANQPSYFATGVNVTKSNPTAGTTWEWDVTSLLQSISNGASWYGFVITSITPQLQFYSPSAANANNRPVLEVVWKDNPRKPSTVSPSGGRVVSQTKPVVSCNFIDVAGDTSLSGIQVRTFTSEAAAIANTSSEFDSGDVATDVPELDLAETTFAAMANNTTKWFRVRVKDGAGLWSDWSDPNSWVYAAKGTFTLVNPSSADPTIYEATPPISWTLTGRTQKAYQVLVIRKIGAAGSRLVYDSGKITSTETTVTIPSGVFIDSVGAYKIYARIWDTYDRMATPNDPPYYEIQRDITYNYDATVDPPTTLTATADAQYPWVALTWSRSAQPDEWNIYRDNRIIWSGQASELFTSGSSYAIVDRRPSLRRNTTYKVVAVVNGKGSAGSPTATLRVDPLTVMLASIDGSDPVMVWNYEKSMGLVENVGIFQPVGSAPPVQFTQSEYGYQGHVSGQLAAIEDPRVPNLTPQQWRDRFNRLKKFNGAKLYITLIDESFECFISAATIEPIMVGKELRYVVNFDFYQTDWVEP